MTPYKLALWIFKFVLYLTLLFSIPVVIFYGGVITFALIGDMHSKYVAKAEQEKAAEQAKADAAKARAAVPFQIPARGVCDLAVLNNGFSIKHRWREQAGPGVTRLGLSLGTEYVDIATNQISSFEKDNAGCN